MAVTRRARGPRTAADTVRGLGALLLIAGLLVGIPAGLLAVAGSPPLPATLPGLDEIVTAIARPDDGTLLVAALTWVGWAGWATLAVSIAVEIPAVARGVRAPRIPALGPQQRIAAGLVAAAALLFAGGPASLAVSEPAHAGTTPAEAAAAPLEESSEPSERVEQDPPRVHIVERGDTLWDIAETHLGSGHRYPELYEASKHTTQPDGRQLTDPNLIQPGWKITTPTGDDPATDDPATDDPATDDPATDSQTAGPAADDSADDERGDLPHRVPDRSASPSTQTSGPTVDTPSPPPVATSTPAPVRADQVDVADDGLSQVPSTLDAIDNDDPDGTGACTVGGIGAALAGGLLIYLGALRVLQHRHRRPGQRIALPAGAAEYAEEELRRIQNPLTLDHVNRSLRTLAARCAMTATPLPAIRFARLLRGQFELYLAEPAEPLAPFLPTANRMLWVLDPDGDILDADQANDYPAPYPSLISVGHDLDGGLIMVDLEHVRCLAVDGDAAGATEVMAAIAAELATSVWSDDVHVTTVGSALELANVLDAGRIRHLEATDQRIDQLIEEMTARTDADRAALADVEVATLGAARLSGVAEGAWAPEILVVAAPTSSSQRERLAELVHAEPRVAIATVVSGGGPPLLEWGIHLQPSDPGHSVVEPIGLGVTPQRLSSQEYANLVQLLAATQAQPTTSAPSWHVDPIGETGLVEVSTASSLSEDERFVVPLTDGDDQSRAAQDTAARTVSESAGPEPPPLVAVLGPVEIHHAPNLAEPSKRGQLTALAAYLALNPGQTRDAVDEAMWPGRRVSLATRNTAMTKLRNWLGTDPDGHDYVPRATTDGYRLHAAVRTDWQVFCELVPDGPAKASTTALIAALELVRDQPFRGVNPRRYVWAERIQQEMIAAIGDVADELARRALQAGDHRLALTAVMTGLAAEPGSEMLWRHRLRAHHAANDREALDQAADQLTALADELGGDLEDETTDLLTELFSPVRAGRTATTPRRTR